MTEKTQQIQELSMILFSSAGEVNSCYVNVSCVAVATAFKDSSFTTVWSIATV